MIISTTHIVKVILDIHFFPFLFFFKRIIISRLQFFQQNLILHFLINLLIFLISFSKAVKSRQLREILVSFSNRNLITRSRSLQDFFHFRWKSDGVWKVISYQLQDTTNWSIYFELTRPYPDWKVPARCDLSRALDSDLSTATAG